MWNEIISMAMNNGLWAVLFCLLFLYEIKDSRRREHKYQDTVSKLTDSMEIIRDVREDCGEIKDEIRNLKGRTKIGGQRVKSVIDRKANVLPLHEESAI